MGGEGRYEPVALLARGGTCEIWLGVLEGAAGFRKPVVLKRAFARADEALDAAEGALAAEGHVSAALSHPNIVHVYELVRSPEGLLLAMEYLPGLSLRSVLASQARAGAVLPWPIAARVVADAARGLEHAHGASSATGQALRVIHRDVSPDNLVVTEGGITKVVDFGIARSTLRDATTGFVIKGKVAYMSPEQVRAEALDERTDVFSLGVVLWEALATRRLFARGQTGRTIEAVLAAPVPELPDSMSPVVRDVVRRMLVRDARSRRITMREVADSLEAAVSAGGGSHRDVATFLRAELGDELARRRERLKELLSRPSVVAAVDDGDTETGTMLALEAVLDLGGASGRPGGPPAPADTVVDGGLHDTLVERPLLSGSKKAR